MSAQIFIGIDVSRDWLDSFCLPGKQRFRCQNSPDGHARLFEILQSTPDDLKVGFEATGGQEWVLWRVLIRKGINAVQLPSGGFEEPLIEDLSACFWARGLVLKALDGDFRCAF